MNPPTLQIIKPIKHGVDEFAPAFAQNGPHPPSDSYSVGDEFAQAFAQYGSHPTQ